MSNKAKEMNIKKRRDYFSIISVRKMLIRMILKQMKSHTKTFLFTALGM